MSEVPLGPGSRLGRYEIIEALGAGAMGKVYLARDVSLARRVAIKVLGDVHLHRDDLRARFAREARAVAAISHPNVVQIFDISEDDGRPYFVMEYLKGTDADAMLKRRGRLGMSEAVAIGLSSALGLSEAAATGVVHRDVKPANLFLTDRGVVKVTDFGLATGFELGANLTGDGVTLGTPDYMPPEQGQGLPVDTRADIYALGATLFHLLTGHPPFRGIEERVGYAEVVVRQIREPTPRLEEEVPGIDADLAELVFRMLAKHPAERPTYEEVIAQLREVALRINAHVPQLSASGSVAALTVSGATTRGGGLAADAGNQPAPAQASVTLRRPTLLPGWAVGLSAASLVLFLGAAALYLYVYALPPLQPPEQPPQSGAGRGSGSGSSPGARPGTGWRERLQKLTPSDSVLLISTVTGPIAVSKLPVSPAQVRAAAPRGAVDLGKMRQLDGVAASGLSLQTARLVTAKLGGRLPTRVEWVLIEASRKVRILPDACEWVDDGPTAKARCFKGQREVLRDPRRPYKNSLFRVVRMLEAGPPG